MGSLTGGQHRTLCTGLISRSRRSANSHGLLSSQSDRTAARPDGLVENGVVIGVHGVPCGSCELEPAAAAVRAMEKPNIEAFYNGYCAKQQLRLASLAELYGVTLRLEVGNSPIGLSESGDISRGDVSLGHSNGLFWPNSQSASISAPREIAHSAAEGSYRPETVRSWEIIREAAGVGEQELEEISGGCYRQGQSQVGDHKVKQGVNLNQGQGLPVIRVPIGLVLSDSIPGAAAPPATEGGTTVIPVDMPWEIRLASLLLWALSPLGPTSHPHGPPDALHRFWSEYAKRFLPAPEHLTGLLLWTREQLGELQARGNVCIAEGACPAECILIDDHRTPVTHFTHSVNAWLSFPIIIHVHHLHHVHHVPHHLHLSGPGVDG